MHLEVFMNREGALKQVMVVLDTEISSSTTDAKTDISCSTTNATGIQLLALLWRP